MKQSEFRALIREEIKKILKESPMPGTVKFVTDMAPFNSIRNKFKNLDNANTGSEPVFNFQLRQLPDNKDEANEYTLPVGLQSSTSAQRQLAKVNSLSGGFDQSGHRTEKFRNEFMKLQQIIYLELYKKVSDIYGKELPAVALVQSYGSNNFYIAFDAAFDKVNFLKIKKLLDGVYRLNKSDRDLR
jgi:hypothetical protein